MKKKIEWFLFVLVLTLFICFYSVIDKNNGIYDEKCDSGDYTSIALSKGEGLAQSFVSEEEVLDGVSVKMSVTGESEEKEISYVLKNSDSQIIASGKASLEELKPGKYFALKFDRVTGCKDNEYTLAISVTRSEEAGEVVLYEVPGKQSMTELTINSAGRDGTLALRTITHRFDIETFIVTVVFALYVIVFIKWLSKVFK